MNDQPTEYEQTIKRLTTEGHYLAALIYPILCDTLANDPTDLGAVVNGEHSIFTEYSIPTTKLTQALKTLEDQNLIRIEIVARLAD